MSTFFQQTAQAMIAKHIDRFPLLKLDQVIDWQPIEQYLNRQRTRYLRDHRGRPAYPLLPMFKAVLLGQWHSLSDPELEHSLITRIDFNLFCRFDELRPLQKSLSPNSRKPVFRVSVVGGKGILQRSLSVNNAQFHQSPVHAIFIYTRRNKFRRSLRHSLAIPHGHAEAYG